MRRSIPTSKVDREVWNWLSSLLEDEATLRRGISAMTERRVKELQPKKKRLETLTSLLARSEAKINRLIDELTEFEGDTVREAVKEKIKFLEAEQRLLCKEKDDLKAELAQVEISPEIESQVMETAAQVRSRLPERTFENMRFLLDKLNVNVIFINDNEGSRIKVSCAIPGTNKDIAINSS